MTTASARIAHDRRATLSAIALAAFATALAAVVVALPGIEDARPTLGWTVRFALRPVCHQIPERSLTVADVPLPLCARCTGLLVGGVGGLVAGAALAAWRRRIGAGPFLAAVAPTVIDGALATVSWSPLGNVPRACLAVPAGLACGWFLAAAAGEVARRRGAHRPMAAGAVSG